MNISNGEMKLMELIWANEPIRSGEVVARAYDAYGWKKSTVYTVVKKLSDKGFLRSENAVITSLVKQENALSEQSEKVIRSGFGGSLPMFLTAFLSKEKLSQSEADELKRLIDSYTEEKK